MIDGFAGKEERMSAWYIYKVDFTGNKCQKAEILANARAMGHDCVDGEDGVSRLCCIHPSSSFSFLLSDPINRWRNSQHS